MMKGTILNVVIRNLLMYVSVATGWVVRHILEAIVPPWISKATRQHSRMKMHLYSKLRQGLLLLVVVPVACIVVALYGLDGIINALPTTAERLTPVQDLLLAVGAGGVKVVLVFAISLPALMLTSRLCRLGVEHIESRASTAQSESNILRMQS